MPVTKNALQRYRYLNRKFRTKRKYTLEQLSEDCVYDEHIGDEVSPHTLRKDIAAMRRIYKVDIQAKDQKYWYADPTANINESRLTDNDVSELRRISQILQQFDYLPQLAGLQNLILKLRNQVGLLGERPEDVIAFEQVVVQGVSFLTPIYYAIIQKHPLSITYHPFDFAEPMVQIYHPYFLKEFNNRWYVLTFNENTQRIEIIALDRIVALETISRLPYRKDENNHFRSFFDHIIGVTLPSDGIVEDIVLRFKPIRAKYVKSKQWHHSQETLADTEGYCDIGFKLIVNKELVARILEFGQDVEVIAPKHLRLTVMDILKSSLDRYK